MKIGSNAQVNLFDPGSPGGVAWSRLGSPYSTAGLRAALENRTLLELQAMIRPREDLTLYRADLAARESADGANPPGWRSVIRDWLRANDACRRDIIDRLGASGPLPSRDLPDTCAVPWRSTGWSNNRNVSRLLEMYKPAAQRRWGYFALPIVHGDRPVGKLDATPDRQAGLLRVHAVHQDVPFTRAVTAAVGHEIRDLVRWLGLELALAA